LYSLPQGEAAIAACTTRMAEQLGRQAEEDREAQLAKQRAAAQKRKADQVIFGRVRMSTRN